VVYFNNLTSGHVLLSSCTTTTEDSLCSQRDDGITKHHHTSVSCSSKVCQYSASFCILNIVRRLYSRLCGKKHLVNYNYKTTELSQRWRTARCAQYMSALKTVCKRKISRRLRKNLNITILSLFGGEMIFGVFQLKRYRRTDRWTIYRGITPR